MSTRLMLKLAAIPIRRSWFLLGLMMVSFAQLLLVLWFAASIFGEIKKTESYAQTAKFVTLQVKDNALTVDQVRDKIPHASDQSAIEIEELKTEDVLTRMSIDEPDLVQTIRSMGSDGISLLPKVILVRGEISESTLEQLKLMTEISKVEVSPIHHARLMSFYHHLADELRFGFILFLFLVIVQLLVFQRVQQRDLNEVVQNLLAWGAGYGRAKLPGAFSLFLLSLASMAISGVEWWLFNEKLGKGNAFLGELSLNRSLTFPFSSALILMAVILGASLVISFAGRGAEE